MKKKKKIKSKRYLALKEKIDREKEYSVREALELVKETAGVKFDATVEVHIRLGIDVKKGDQQVRGTAVLPQSFGKEKKICVFTTNQKEAKEAGVDMLGGEDLIKEIKSTGKIEFDVAVATPEIMPKLAGIAKILGPKGLMPSPKNETVTTNIKKTIEELRKGKMTFKNDDTANLHQAIGKASWSVDKLLENYEAFFEIVKKSKPAGSKGEFVRSVYLSSTMGPSVRVGR